MKNEPPSWKMNFNSPHLYEGGWVSIWKDWLPPIAYLKCLIPPLRNLFTWIRHNYHFQAHFNFVRPRPLTFESVGHQIQESLRLIWADPPPRQSTTALFPSVPPQWRGRPSQALWWSTSLWLINKSQRVKENRAKGNGMWDLRPYAPFNGHYILPISW